MKSKQIKLFISLQKVICLCMLATIAFIGNIYAGGGYHSYLSHDIALSQQKIVTGKVTDSQGMPLPGVSITIKGNSTKGVATDFDGNYTIDVKTSDVLVFSYIGFSTQEIPVGGKTKINVVLKETAQELDQVVVTALGIKRSEKSLPYATQKVDAKELTEVPSSNILSNLAGKTAGMMVSNSGAGVGSSVKVVLRGNRSIFGNNQPLYIIDGTPINSASFTDGANADGGFGGEMDAGDGLASLNPNDIESVNILKGASAAALYGSQAANGVIMITTKRGSSEKTSVNFQSSFQADVPYMTYEFQDRYGMGSKGVAQNTNLQWGEKSKGDLSNDFISDFFQTGNLFTNSVSVSGGSKKTQNYVSYQNTTGKGIMPKNTFDKHNVAIRSTTSLFDDFIKIEGSISLMKQSIDHAPSAPGRYFNPIVGLYLFPEGTSEFNKYKNEYEIFEPKKNVMKSNWRSSDQGINQNPYWLINRYNYSYDANKSITKLNLTFNLSESLNLQLRGSYDDTQAEKERRVNWGVEVITGSQGGRYEVYNDNFTESYADALLNYHKTFENLDVTATLGTSISDKKVYRKGIKIGDLKIPNFFHLNNFGVRPINRIDKEHRQLQAVFGTLSLGWKSMLYLDLTARNDWASTLPKDNRSYFYPSIGTSFIFTELMKQNGNIPEWLSFGKFRASWTQVGNDMPWGKTIVYDNLNESGDVEKNTVAPFEDLKPERSSAFETGINARLFNNRVSLDVAFYQTDTENQYFLVDAPSGTGFSKYYINAGKIRNRGWEVTLGVEPIRSKDFNWNTSFNFTKNNNTIVSLPEQYKETGLKLSSGGFSYLLKEGDEWGEMYMKRAKRDEQGRIIVVEKDGNAQLQEDNKETRIGNVNPDFMLGWNNQLRYKNFALNFQFDGRFGGKVISTTQTFLNKYGRSKESADARDAGGILVNGVTPDGKAYTKPIDAQTYYTSKEGDLAMYEATNIRLRELSLSYSLPKSVLSHLKVVTDARISLIGRNLFYIYRDAPFDPEMVLSTTTNSASNVDNFSIPMSRSMGVSLNVNF